MRIIENELSSLERAFGDLIMDDIDASKVGYEEWYGWGELHRRYVYRGIRLGLMTEPVYEGEDEYGETIHKCNKVVHLYPVSIAYEDEILTLAQEYEWIAETEEFIVRLAALDNHFMESDTRDGVTSLLGIVQEIDQGLGPAYQYD